jgi:predicted methyltransferase
MTHTTHLRRRQLNFGLAAGLLGGGLLPPALALASTAGPAAADAPSDPALQAAVANPARTPAFAARDAARRPLQTLSFFGFRADLRVVEINPGGGWYTEILAPALRERGQLVLAAPSAQSTSDYARRAAQRLQAKLQASPAMYDRVQLSVFEPPAQVELAAPGSMDLVLTFRNVHNWVAQGDDAVRAVFGGAARALKPGGVFGVVEHRLPAARTQDAKASSGYVHEAYVVRMAEAVGLRLQAASEVNANPADTADHPGGVWALPPVLRHKDKDRERYVAIGESDRMTLRFVKA